MRSLNGWIFGLALGLVTAACWAQEPGVAKPQLILQELVRGMPNSDSQEIRIMTASFKPGDRTVFHTHRFPVAVYILEGAFTLELEGHAPKTIKAGEGMVEPPNVKMTGFNRSTKAPLRLVIFYVSDPDTPFLDPIH
ncbi:MAG: cupin domain-containing protein [Gammaproteobacteria bacterium]